MSTNTDSDVITDIDIGLDIKIPSLYKVIILNDNYTPMNFVIDVLTGIFNKNEADATNLMMQVHEEGQGIAGVYTKEVAEQKVEETTLLANHFKHPLKTIAEKE